ncbi:hypothetical protein [Laspinema olomoucense]|uniref:hypothetical protein n=1 Tax=Laspinema olomoucense TaxID=3231600 RepID=UPI0021BADFF0|nr:MULTISPECIES: hypothetical protein [unclassified Laspinema]MCT7972178.1 hypothetical protein [Laspinema sp. D3d]MCT7990474.1 hypothetical protein [Laspinema sp. D3a]
MNITIGTGMPLLPRGGYKKFGSDRSIKTHTLKGGSTGRKPACAGYDRKPKQGRCSASIGQGILDGKQHPRLAIAISRNFHFCLPHTVPEALRLRVQQPGFWRQAIAISRQSGL